jgi:hypothetical protein
MKREFNVIIERDAEGYYVARVPELRGCHTQAKSLDALMKRGRRLRFAWRLRTKRNQPWLDEEHSR